MLVSRSLLLLQVRLSIYSNLLGCGWHAQVNSAGRYGYTQFACACENIELIVALSVLGCEEVYSNETIICVTDALVTSCQVEASREALCLGIGRSPLLLGQRTLPTRTVHHCKGTYPSQFRLYQAHVPFLRRKYHTLSCVLPRSSPTRSQMQILLRQRFVPQFFFLHSDASLAEASL